MENPWIVAIGTGIVLLLLERALLPALPGLQSWLVKNKWVQTALISLVVASVVGWWASGQVARSIEERIIALEADHPHSAFVVQVASELATKHSQNLVGPAGPKGEPGQSVTAESVAQVLMAQYADELRGRDGVRGVEGPQGIPGASATLPTSIVLASTSPCNTLEPRNTWTEYAEAAGRFLLGAGKGPLAVAVAQGSTGGHQTHTLTLPELPRHSHEMTNLYTRKGQGSSSNHTNYSRNENAGWRTSEEGGGKPHNNMPPYIALYFCKKEGR